MAPCSWVIRGGGTLFLANWRLGRSHVLEFLLPCNFVMRALGRVFRGTFRGKGHTGRCSPKRDLRFGVLRTALGAISNKKQQIMHKNTVLDDYTTYDFCPLPPSVNIFSDAVPERFSCRRRHAFSLFCRTDCRFLVLPLERCAGFCWPLRVIFFENH